MDLNKNISALADDALVTYASAVQGQGSAPAPEVKDQPLR